MIDYRGYWDGLQTHRAALAVILAVVMVVSGLEVLSSPASSVSPELPSASLESIGATTSPSQLAAGLARENRVSCNLSSEGKGGAYCETMGATPLSGQTSPGAQWGSSMTYDAADGYMVMLQGGTNPNDTWILSDGSWARLSSSEVSPPPRSWACLTYDWRDGYVLLFGGGRGGIATPNEWMGDTWTYQGGVWTNITNEADSPPPLLYDSCTYDAADGYVLLFGGALSRGPAHTGSSGPTIHSSNETWEFSGGTWRNVTSYDSPHPSARFGAMMAYDSVDRYVLLYGGAVNGTSTGNGSCSAPECPHLSDTWKFGGGVWTNITASASDNGTPPGRWEGSMTNDSSDGYILSFGGQDNGYKSLNATGNYTWKFVAGTWSNISSGLMVSPSTRFGAAITYDPHHDTVVMFGGLSGTLESAPGRDDTWVFYDGQWFEMLLGAAVPPSVPTFSAITETAASVAWTQGYFVDGSLIINNTVLVGTTCGSWTLVEPAGGAATSYDIRALTEDTTYCVAIEMWNMTGHITGGAASFTTAGKTTKSGAITLSRDDWAFIGAGIVTVLVCVLLVLWRRSKKRGPKSASANTDRSRVVSNSKATPNPEGPKSA